MSESFRTTPPDQPWSPSEPRQRVPGRFRRSRRPMTTTSPTPARVVLVGVLGGLLSAAGYMIYRRLPEEQKQRLQSQVRTMVQQRITEIRQNFNI